MQLNHSGFPYPEETIFWVGAQEVLMWVLGDADHILLVHIEGSLQLASGGGEAVEDEVLPNAVDPFSSWWECAADEITSCSLSRGERSHNLTLGKNHSQMSLDNKIGGWEPACSWWQLCWFCCKQPFGPCSWGFKVIFHWPQRDYCWDSPWQNVDRVDVHISTSGTSQGFEGVLALCGFGAPHLLAGAFTWTSTVFLTLTVPSLDPLSTWWPSGVKDTELT